MNASWYNFVLRALSSFAQHFIPQAKQNTVLEGANVVVAEVHTVLLTIQKLKYFNI